MGYDSAFLALRMGRELHQRPIQMCILTVMISDEDFAISAGDALFSFILQFLMVVRGKLSGVLLAPQREVISPVAKNKHAKIRRLVTMRQREEAFMSRYDALFRFAFSLTNDRAEADDLLQDCYALFVSANRNAPIEDLDAYLRRMLSNLRQSNLMRQTNGQPNQNKPDKAAPLSRTRSDENKMLRQNNVNSAQTKRNPRQIVADAYTWLWDLFWLPIGLISKLCWRFKLFPKKWASWLFGLTLGRYPEKIHDDHYTLCTDSHCETCRSLAPGELDIDDEREIKHDPFRVLSNLKHNS